MLGGVDWETYQTISGRFTGRHLRLTYDRGTLEFMTISSTHGNFSRLIVHLVFVLAEEFNLSSRSCGDMTCDREDQERGVEPDECFYLANEHLIRDKEQIDLAVDPPPDLAVEIDISRSSQRRLGIYAAIKVPEVWQFDGETLRVLQLGSDGQYFVAERSLYFPSVPLLEIAGFLRRRKEMDEVSLVRLFRAWVRNFVDA